MPTAKKIDLDLDVARGESKWVRLHGKNIEVLPLDLEEIYAIQDVIEEYQDLDNIDDTRNSLARLKDFHAEVEKLIPDLEGVRCTIGQLQQILQLAFENSIPQDQKELAKRGITPADHKKKAVRTTP